MDNPDLKMNFETPDLSNAEQADERGLSNLNALLVASKQEWLEEAKKMIDGMTADEFESFIIGCSVEDTEKAFYEASKKMGW